MAEKKTELGLSQFVELAAAVIRALPRNISTEFAQGLIDDPGNLRIIFETAFRDFCFSDSSTISLIVNYSRRVEDGIKAGKYDRVYSDITQDNFPPNRTGTASVKVQLVHFGREMTTDDVIGELNKQGLRPAELPELLVLGENYPDIQREYPIVALGSRWQFLRGHWRVPCLSGSGAGRSLRLDRIDNGWIGVCRFAAVSK